MPNPAHSVLLFDLGGVLIESDMFSELRRLMKTDQTEAQLIEVWMRNPVARRFELGQCSVDEFALSIVSEFRLSLAPADFLAAFETWPTGFYDGVERMLAELRTRYTVACLSNSNEVHWTDAITDHFDFAFSSHLIEHIKPDRGAFDHVLDAIGVEANAVCFFDDAPMNVQAARRYGLNAHHTVGYETLKSRLMELRFLS